MTENDSTQSPSSKLPVSTRPLKDFHCLCTTHCQVLDSLEIAPPPEWTAYGPTGNLFEYPIQVVVLESAGDQVELGFYAHPALVAKKGSPPDQVWQDAWKHHSTSREQESNQQQGQITEKTQSLKLTRFSRTFQDAQDGLNYEDLMDQTHRAADMVSYFNAHACDLIAEDFPLSLGMLSCYVELYRDFLRRLPELGAETQVIFMLHRYEGLSIKEIASQQAISERDVEVHLESAFGVFSDLYQQSVYDLT